MMIVYSVIFSFDLFGLSHNAIHDPFWQVTTGMSGNRYDAPTSCVLELTVASLLSNLNPSVDFNQPD